MKNLLLIILLLSLFSVYTVAQPSFNYDQITICEGDTYDLLNYQTNEVTLPVDWEIIGWQGITNTTVTPAVSPTVYTLEYREKTNPSVVLTKNLTITLRPKPIVKVVSPQLNTCIGNTVEIKKQSADNYDDSYWLWVETGTEYRQDDITLVTDYNMPTRQTYKLVATNQHCATIAQAETTVRMVDIRQSNMDFSFLLGAIDYSSPLRGWRRPYCKPVILNDFIGCRLGLPHYNTTGKISMTDKPEPGQQYQQDNGFARVNYIKIVWDNEDAYTAGAPLSGIASYSNTFHVEAEVFWKQCNQTVIYTSESYRLELYDNCEGIFYWANFECNIRNGMNRYQMTHSNLDSIIAVDFVNKTHPGQYIPTWQTILTDGSVRPDYYVQFDENTPTDIFYDITVTYRALDESERTYTFYNIKPPACKAENIAEYAIANEKNGIGFSNRLICYNDYPTYEHLCYNVGTTSPAPRSVSRTICDTEKAYFSIRSYNPAPWVIEFDTDDVFPMIIGSGTSTTIGGKTVYTCTPAKNPNSVYDSYVEPYMQFEVDGVQKTYTGKINGVAFSFTVNIDNYRLAAQDTIICSGTPFDLKTLEIANNINGSALWNTGGNTVVSPLVDTEYLVYGVGKYKCASQPDYTRTDTVTVKVDPPIWATASNVTGNTGDNVSLNDYLNTNARTIEWFDENDNPVGENITIEQHEKTYTCKLTNVCGTEKRQITVKSLSAPPPCPGGIADTTYISDSIFVGENYIKHDFTIPVQNTPRIFNDTLYLQNHALCDSLAILTLKVKSVASGICSDTIITINDSICRGEGYSKYGFVLPVQINPDTTIVQKKDLYSRNGCDSIVILNLTVNRTYKRIMEVFIEENVPIVINGQKYSEPGVVVHTYASNTGCDSTIITIIDYKDGDMRITGCDPIIPDKFFTPNHDNRNDFWTIKNIECYEHSVYIYDRFSKLLIHYPNNFDKWDGMYLGKPMPSSDYWYLIELKDEKALVGHFTLIR